MDKITLENISPEKLEEIKRQINYDIKIADDYYESEIEPLAISRREAIDSSTEYYQKKFPRLSKITDLTSSDVADTIEWCMPSLMRTFFGGEDVVVLQGTTEEDDPAAETMQALIQYQLERHNNAFMVFHDWFKSALGENVGVLKCYWERQTQVKESYEIYLNQVELQTLSQQPGIKVTTVEQQPTGEVRVEYDVVSLIKNQPVLEVVPVSELRFSPDAKDIDKAEFVAHRRIVTADYLRRKEIDGIYRSVKKALEDAGPVKYTEYDTRQNPYLDNFNQNNTNTDTDKARKKVVLYECYTKLDVNEDGLLEDVIVTVVNNEILRLDENTMGRHPFFLLSPIRDPHRIWAKKGLCDLISQLQDLKTALLRQIIFNISQSNDKQAFVNIDNLVDVNEFIEGKKAVRVQGNPKETVYWSPMEQLQPQVFDLLSYVDELRENRAGVTKYTQGTDANTLNKTATGITQIMQASNQRLELISRMFLETGINQLFRHLIRLNQQFIDNNVVIRITNKSKVVTPDDLQGEIDIKINAGMGTGSKQSQMQYLQMLISLYPQLIQFGVAAPYHASYVIGKLIEAMGWKNKTDFCFTPEQVQQNQQQQQAQQQQMQQDQMGQMQQQQEQQMQQQQMQQASDMQAQQAQQQIQQAQLEHQKQQHQDKMDVDKTKIMLDMLARAHEQRQKADGTIPKR